MSLSTDIRLACIHLVLRDLFEVSKDQDLARRAEVLAGAGLSAPERLWFALLLREEICEPEELTLMKIFRTAPILKVFSYVLTWSVCLLSPRREATLHLSIMRFVSVRRLCGWARASKVLRVWMGPGRSFESTSIMKAC